MTKKHFTRAAEIVNSIRLGFWTNEPPDWDEQTNHVTGWLDVTGQQRAVQTAEAFIMLFKDFGKSFDEPRFLKACGLIEEPKS